jgi:trans-2,3-dihydro-3-hydroxyanthranilate isomerase
MTDLRFVTMDVFTSQRHSGNPLAVMIHADSIPDAAMAKIAREFNLSETVFIQSPDQAGSRAKLRIFTPGAELPFAGHPTIGAAIYLAQSSSAASDSFVLETKAGLVSVSVDTKDGGTQARLRAPQIPQSLAAVAPDQLAAALSLPMDALVTGAFAPQAWSVGSPFNFVGLKDRATLSSAKVNNSVWAEIEAQSGSLKIFAFTLEDWAGGTKIDARMFAPSIGVPEDPATGSASAALVGLLTRAQAKTPGHHAWTISQGVDMGRPSIIGIEAQVDEDGLREVFVSGHAVFVSEGHLLALN